MKPKTIFLRLSILGALGLASCDMFDSGSGGRSVNNPTVEQMAQLEKQWGVEPRDIRPRRSTAPVGSEPSGSAIQSGTPQVAAPEPAPLPPTQASAPPVYQQAPPAATPAQIQKLKN
jgi:hypothetical protein